MENMVMHTLFNGVYTNKRVLVTGHTGFKGSWLVKWLQLMGAEVIGYAQKADTMPSHFELLNLDMPSVIGDITDRKKLSELFTEYKPQIVFHLAAQALVRASYKDPLETFRVNIMGTATLLEVCRESASVEAVINVTSDKAYENREWEWGYRETDTIGGHDPYSASKGCSELLTASYQNSFFKTKLLASCRAGNVIGGGDWSEDRLVPDIIKAIQKEEEVVLRNPNATRPWQHVLEPLSGYLLVGQKLLEHQKESATAWNFGPNETGNISVENVLLNIQTFYPALSYKIETDEQNPHEANLLKLDCSKAHRYLQWKSVWNTQKTFEKTALWYKKFYELGQIDTINDIKVYVKDAKKERLIWAI